MGVNDYVPLDPGHFFTGIITFLIRRIGVLDALRVNDPVTGQGGTGMASQLSHKKLTCSSMETKASGESVNFSIVA